MRHSTKPESRIATVSWPQEFFSNGEITNAVRRCDVLLKFSRAVEFVVAKCLTALNESYLLMPVNRNSRIYVSPQYSLTGAKIDSVDCSKVNR